jgi:hypothetical protein
MQIKNPRFKGSKTGGEASIANGTRRPLREEKRETVLFRPLLLTAGAAESSAVFITALNSNLS